MSADGRAGTESRRVGEPDSGTSARFRRSAADATDPSLSRGRTEDASEPPTGSRNLGGRCPRCRDRLESRLKVRYDDELSARLLLEGYCRSCTYYVEGRMVTFAMDEVRL
ncbi:hypothetical protein C491_05696 [Natronococcus amylolyticus DSM 10524]|uniref:Uncharacterized protein n=1 Tax=Natronococcus amylolyticus DSM 10524 TaxID=1227497 RepID=L9XDY5_9EURY|nr:hypothetical protein [Natronococcus amylolyticus]ELY59837.1 hypothetical protein C491_05696 [Natronococcus amylolyticus DSM 10524]